MTVESDIQNITQEIADINRRLMHVRSSAISHNLLSARHPDTTAAAVVRGDLITGQGAIPSWTRFPIGVANRFLKSDGTDPVWATILVGDLPAHAAEHIVGGGDLVDHDQLTNWVANKHIDWTAAATNFLTSGTVTTSDDVHLTGAGKKIHFSGTAGGGNEGIDYKDAGGTQRWGLMFPGGDVVRLANRAANGTLQFCANTAVAGAGGEILSIKVEDDAVSLWPSITAGNPSVYIFGWDAGSASVKYGQFYIDADGKFCLTAEEAPMRILRNLKWEDDMGCLYGGGTDARILFSNTNNTLTIGIPIEAADRGLIICDEDDYAVDVTGLLAVTNFPRVAILDTDTDSYLALDWSADDMPRITCGGNATSIEVTGCPSVTVGAWTKSIGAGGDYANWAAMIADMPDLLAHAVTVTIETGTTLTEICALWNKHGLNSTSEIIIQAEKYHPTSGAPPTADSATATTLRDASEFLIDDEFNDCWVLIIHGTGTDNGYVPITDTDGVNHDIIVAAWPGTQPDNTSRYIIVGALIDCGGTINYCFSIQNNTAKIYFYGIGFEDADIINVLAYYNNDIYFWYCGTHAADNDGFYFYSNRYNYVYGCGIVNNNTDNNALRAGIRSGNTALSMYHSGISDNNQRGIYFTNLSNGFSSNNFGDGNGNWGAYCVYAGQARFSGTECSGGLGNHSDPGTAGAAASDQAAGY